MKCVAVNVENSFGDLLEAFKPRGLDCCVLEDLAEPQS